MRIIPRRRNKRKIPLKVELYVTNQYYFVKLLTDLGYRENKSWGEDEEEILNKLCKLAHKATEEQLKILKEKD